MNMLFGVEYKKISHENVARYLSVAVMRYYKYESEKEKLRFDAKRHFSLKIKIDYLI